MRDIKIGEYIRTKYGIAKFIDYEIERLGIIVVDKKIAYDHIDEYKNIITPKEILKHSFNIIDLIEEGDVITLKNGRIYEVLRISWSKSKGTHIHIINPLRLEGGIDIFKEDIKSIVTKEMFQNIGCRVESN